MRIPKKKMKSIKEGFAKAEFAAMTSEELATYIAAATDLRDLAKRRLAEAELTKRQADQEQS